MNHIPKTLPLCYDTKNKVDYKVEKKHSSLFILKNVNSKKTILLFVSLVFLFTNVIAHELHAYICIYGTTSSGVIASYTAKKLGKSVIFIEPANRIGGLTTGGLGLTDIGNPFIMKGYTYTFYKKIGQDYGNNGEKRDC